MKKLALPTIGGLVLISAIFAAGYHTALWEVHNDCYQVGVAEVMPVDEYIECVVLEDAIDEEGIEDGPAYVHSAKFVS